MKYQNYKSNHKPKIGEKGVSILLVALVLTVILTISAAISLAVRRELSFSRDASESVVAFFAADAGMERSLYNSRYASEPVNVTGSLSNGSSYEVEVDTSNPLSTVIRSDGLFRNTKRAIEISY